MPKEVLNKSFDRLRTNGKCLIPFVVSCLLSEVEGHERNQLVKGFPNNNVVHLLGLPLRMSKFPFALRQYCA